MIPGGLETEVTLAETSALGLPQEARDSAEFAERVTGTRAHRGFDLGAIEGAPGCPCSLREPSTIPCDYSQRPKSLTCRRLSARDLEGVGKSGLFLRSARWRRKRDSNPRDSFEPCGFQDRRLQPLGHSSAYPQPSSEVPR